VGSGYTPHLELEESAFECPMIKKLKVIPDWLDGFDRKE